ncbi:hypothetical protein PTSG_00567 [Salpingoeca rosetta]|uniref:CNH domain-containing protein n=1 Tax=Salpingoeca rosetta (strain ATCC 50818 / BSB-021) TaxID=946362 RepID=F2TWU8_SALR5|nr:uncharacterized protein PTSG_00567 [Salpingoeca rosetta]EGD72544.1 hypothetical protein PTSG_00567 [Salpingoeca rosetta]|eukprot:XP_004999113.1 hypothetical protein PTSG_00567 [Salpingoeca rosetta]
MALHAFELLQLLPAVANNKASVVASALDMWEDSLWIGTNEGHIVYHHLTSELSSGQTKTIKCNYKKQTTIIPHKPITQLTVAPRQRKLLVLSESCLYILFMDNLNHMESHKHVQLKNVSRFCVDRSHDPTEDGVFEITVVFKKGAIKSYELVGNVLTPNKRLKEFREAQEILDMEREGRALLVAQRDAYYRIDLLTTSKKHITNVGTATPRVKWLQQNEFLVVHGAGAQALAICIQANGEPLRSPMQWVEGPTSIAFTYPYVVGMYPSVGTLSVFSILDLAPVQVFDCKEPTMLFDVADGQILVARGRSVLLLALTSFHAQISHLISEGLVDEALTLMEATISKELEEVDDANEADEIKKKRRRLRRDAGLALLGQRNFKRGFELLQKALTPPGALLPLFPLLSTGALKVKQTRISASAPFSSIDDIVESDEQRAQAYISLARYMEAVRSKLTRNDLVTVDTALVIIYAMYEGESLNAFVAREDTQCNIEQCASFLASKKKLHALACLHAQAGQYRKALEIWRSLQEDATQVDPDYPGVEYVIDVLSNMDASNPTQVRDLVFRNIDWILPIAPEACVHIFTAKSNTENQHLFPPPAVLDRLADFHTAKMIYLEYLVLTMKSEDEHYHTTLAMMLLDAVKRTRLENDNKRRVNVPVDEEKLASLRHRFQRVLKSSKRYDVDKLNRFLDDTDFHAERAIVYGRAGQHEKALRLLVYDVEDHRLAEEYCNETTEGDRKMRQYLFRLLLQVYLHPSEGKHPMTAEAVKMLNSDLSDLNVVDVLKIIPDHWSLSVVGNFLRQAIRSDVHYLRTTQLTKGLARSENTQLHKERMMLHQQRVVMDEEHAKCMVCGRDLAPNGQVGPFVRYPNAIITCLGCGSDPYVCPKTGKRFSTRHKTVHKATASSSDV